MGNKMEETNAVQENTMTETIIGYLVGIPLFDKLHAHELRSIAPYMDLIEIYKDEILFKEGDRGDFVCFVADGTLEVAKQSVTGENVVITELSRGRSIGEMSVIGDFPRSATAKALVQTKLIVLTQKGFELILEKHPRIGIKVIKGISRLLSLSLRDTSGRLADCILPLG